MKIHRKMGKSYYKESASPSYLSGPVSKSLLWAFHESPNKWRNGNRTFSPTPAMELGSLIHCMALTPENVDEEYIICPYDSFRTNESKAWRDHQDEAGLVGISEKVWQTAQEASSVLRSQPLYPLCSDTEVAVFGKIDGVKIKGMIDIVPHISSENGDSLWDLKTTASIDSLDALQRLILNRGYHWQSALYLDLYNGATGECRDSFVFIFMESSAPYETAFVRITTDVIELGRQEYLAALAKWKMCVDTDFFPKRIEGIATIDLPKWAKSNL